MMVTGQQDIGHDVTLDVDFNIAAYIAFSHVQILMF